MAEIINTANSHKTSTLVSGQIPNFVHEDHPLFVQFIESYYEFLAQANSGILTSDGTTAYYGADYATKIIPDASDVDTTDFNVFLESFRRQYAPNFPQSTHANVNDRTLYKNLIDFYRAVGTDDSFKMLFRLLYNEEIEIYYPKTDMLIASGGNYSKQNRILVAASTNIEKAANKKIVGASSGAYGTIERVDVLPKSSMSFRSGNISKISPGSSFTASNTSLESIYDSDYLREIQMPRAYVYLTSVLGNFQSHETLYVDDGSSVISSVVANTVLLPQTKKILFFDDFVLPDNGNNVDNANAVISLDSGRSWRSEKSTGPPWGLTSNISYGNTGMWFSSEGTGKIALVANVAASTGYKVLQVGNNSTSALDKHLSDSAVNYSSFPGYGEANGIGGVGATGNVSFIDDVEFSAIGEEGVNHFEIAIYANTTSDPFVGPDGNIWPITQGRQGNYPWSIEKHTVFGMETPAAWDTPGHSVYVMYTSGNAAYRFTNSSPSALPTTGGIDGISDTHFPVAHGFPNGLQTNFFLATWDSRPTIPLAGTGGGWGQTWRVLQNRSYVDPASVNWPGNTVPFIPDPTLGDFIVAGPVHISDLFPGADADAVNDIPNLVVHPDALPKTAYFDEKRRLTFTGDQRHLVMNQSIGIGGEDRLYRMSVRARDLGGNSAISVAEGNRFSAGIECLDKSQRVISANNYNDEWGTAHWLVSDHQSIDDTWFTYVGYFRGRQSKRNSALVSYQSKNHGSGGRKDLPVSGKSYNSPSRAIDGDVVLPFGTTFIRPALRLNEPSSDASYSQGIMQIDYVQIEEMTPIQSQTSGMGGEYLNESSLLSTRGAYLQDNHYRQTYAYDIRSKQQVKNYESIVKSTVHPAGLKMFGTTISESSQRTSDLIDVKPGKITRLTANSLVHYRAPSWSPDGTKIAFHSDEIGPSGYWWEIFVMNADGTNPTRLTFLPHAYSPAWSPDGTKIAFSSNSYPPKYKHEIHVINADGTNLTRLTYDEAFDDRHPSWSPDGTKIAFAANTAIAEGEFRDQIYVMNADGTNQTRLTHSIVGDNQPAWSPDGTKIAFHSYPHPNDAGSGNYNRIYVMNADGTNPTRIPNHSPSIHPPGVMQDYEPSWSPDGTQIALKSWNMAHASSAEPNHNFDIKVMNEDGSNPIWLTSNVAVEHGPSWSPDGTQIAFGSGRASGGVLSTSNTDIYVIDVRERSNTNLLDTFSPDSLDSLAGWFKADAIGPENLQNRQGVDGIHTTTNIIPSGMSDWETYFAGSGDPFWTVGAGGGDPPGDNGIASHSPDSYLGDKSVQIATGQVGNSTYEHAWGSYMYTSATSSEYPTESGPWGSDHGMEQYNIAIAPLKSWLISAWIKTSNNLLWSPKELGETVHQNNGGSIGVNILAQTGSNNAGGFSPKRLGGFNGEWFSPNSENNVWERKSVIIDLTTPPSGESDPIPYQRAMLVWKFRNSYTTYNIDGVMMEEYNPAIHGARGTGSAASLLDAGGDPYTPSAYVRPSMNGDDVMSWYDSSPNKLHAYANTSMVFGSQWAPPQYGANVVAGHPVVRFRSNNVYHNNLAAGNVYIYSSFRNVKSNYMTGLQGKTSPAANTLPRPIANQFTGFVVARTNLTANQTNYRSDVWPWNNHQLFDIGSSQYPSHSAGTRVTDGSYGLALGSAPGASSNGYITTLGANSSGYKSFISSLDDTHTRLPLDTSTSFRIFGISEFATTNTYAATQGKTSDLLTMHYNGRRYANSEHTWSDGTTRTPNDLTREGMSYERQLADDATFYIGHNQIDKYDSFGNRYYWFDGDMAEIVWFNEQLSNTQIALVEGYLAHKYGIADDLIHKDGSGDHPYKYQAPPAVGANNTSY